MNTQRIKLHGLIGPFVNDSLLLGPMMWQYPSGPLELILITLDHPIGTLLDLYGPIAPLDVR
jgi:hypothetical protein